MSDDSDIENNFKSSADETSFIERLKLFSLEDLLNHNKIAIIIALLGFIMLGFGVFLYKNTALFEGNKIEVIQTPSTLEETVLDIVVELSGAVMKPGVYQLKSGSRINDLLITGGGLSGEADREWVEKNINLASKLADGQKLYIRSINEQSNVEAANSEGLYQNVSSVIGAENSNLVNINNSTFDELDKLPGIGQVYGQKIIEQRPYSNIEELLSRKILPKSTFDKIIDKITAY